MGGPDGKSPTTRQGRLALVVAALVVVVDQVSKNWVVANLTTSCQGSASNCIDLPFGITLRLVYNTGAAFSTGTGMGPVLGVAALAISVVLVMLIVTTTNRIQAVLLGAILGGAIGNIADRIFRADNGLMSGAVIDFVDLGWWPVFNIADSAIVVGVIAIMARSLLESRSARISQDQAAENQSPDPLSSDADGEIDSSAPVDQL